MSASIPRASWVVVFEVRPDPARMHEYLAIAGDLRPVLERMPGFLENERFRSLGRPGILLSLSLWESEEAIVRWRTLERHGRAQRAGRDGIFRDYRLRVGMCAPGTMAGAAADSGGARILTLRDVTASDAADIRKEPVACESNAGPATYDVFEHLTMPDRKLSLAAWNDERQAARDLAGRAVDGQATYGGLLVRVVRDYGMRERREAPQHHSSS